MGEVDHAQDPEDDRQSQGCQRVETAGRQPLDGVLEHRAHDNVQPDASAGAKAFAAGIVATISS
ncbi:hypothetical protein Asp14428_17140 [Actinoplanes sp. NBRC 14428]|nr:hypothetical protein Asp14428_17140 [Actinoplanes sp. NBRC 14428]